jgi:hypothetical protein
MLLIRDALLEIGIWEIDLRSYRRTNVPNSIITKESAAYFQSLQKSERGSVEKNQVAVTVVTGCVAIAIVDLLSRERRRMRRVSAST